MHFFHLGCSLFSPLRVTLFYQGCSLIFRLGHNIFHIGCYLLSPSRVNCFPSRVQAYFLPFLLRFNFLLFFLSRVLSFLDLLRYSLFFLECRFLSCLGRCHFLGLLGYQPFLPRVFLYCVGYNFLLSGCNSFHLGCCLFSPLG